MKKKSYLLLAATLLACCIAIVSCNQEDDDWDEMDVSLDVTSRTPMTKSNAMEPGGIQSDAPRFLEYSNCGLWGIAQMCGSADKTKYQGMVLSAAAQAIDWDEETNMEHLKNKENGLLRGLSGDEILLVCKKMNEINDGIKGLDRINGLSNRLPNTFTDNPSEAQQIINNLRMSSNRNTIEGTMVGLETIDPSTGKTIEHWVPLENFSKNGNMQVRDPLTSQKYHNQEYNGTSEYKDRYKNEYSISRVKCVLYRK